MGAAWGRSLAPTALRVTGPRAGTLDARVWFVSGLMASTVLILVEIEKAVPRVMGRQSFRAVD